MNLRKNEFWAIRQGDNFFTGTYLTRRRAIEDMARDYLTYPNLPSPEQTRWKWKQLRRQSYQAVKVLVSEVTP